ncbi:MAG: anthranilate synthase component II [Vulcanimicrobiaceae bacterium]
MSKSDGAQVLLVDNYDSFAHNLAHLFGALGAQVEVVRSDAPALERARVEAADAIVLGPGPGRPEGAGKMLATIAWAAEAGRPLFGVCLGLQALGLAFGARVVNAPRLMHGKTSEIVHDGRGLFAGLPSPFAATRYHSLCLSPENFPDELEILASSDDAVVQAARHRTLPFCGVQFHPESVLTPLGYRIAANVLAAAGVSRANLDERLAGAAALARAGRS